MLNKNSFRAFFNALSLVLGASAASVALAQPVAGEAPRTRGGQSILDQYIVRFSPGATNVAAQARDLTQGAGGAVLHVYEHALKGFSARLPAAAVQALRNNPNVVSVEQDATIYLNTTQNSAPWGLDRIDQVDRPLSSTYEYVGTGQGVRAYVIDTGIRASHTDFSGRVLPGYTAIQDANGTSDCNGHGTHVAGTVGGNTWGVAKQVQLVPVRVLGCTGSGSYSGVIAGVDWVASQIHRPAVANLSLGGPVSASLDAAIAGAVSKGVTMVVAAGNDNTNACNYSPAREASAITVGATTSGDARASYSNFGNCLDVFAPGSGIVSAWYTTDSATAMLNGTSMAAPHTAGVVALMLQARPDASPLAIAEQLKQTASVNKITLAGTGSPNLLLYALGAPQPDVPPVSVAINGLSGRAVLSRSNWRAEATVSVRSLATGTAVGNASVSVQFQPGSTGSCITASNGSCSVLSTAFKNTVTSTEATVRGVSGTNLTYDATQNSATAVRISK